MKRLICAIFAICLVIGMLSVHASAEQMEGAMEGLLDAAVMTAAEEVYEEVEPNDDLENSNLIEHGYTVYGTLSGEDVDVYIFEMGESSGVSVYAAATTDGLAFALFDCETGNMIWESGYYGYDAENGLHIFEMNSNGVEPGVYCLIFLETYYADAEYVFVADIPGNRVCLHEYDGGVVTKKATCTENGIRTFTCSRCGGKVEETIVAPGHSFSGGKCTVCGAKPTDVIAEGLHDSGPVKWKLTADGTLTISGNRSLQSWGDYEWDPYAHLITAVVIENGITNVPDYAFDCFEKLEKVTLGNSVAEIGEQAFRECVKLSSITVPASVTEIGDSAFYGCTGLKEIRYASGSKLTQIGKSAFERSGLLKVTLPAGVQDIPEWAYANCHDLVEAILPEGVVNVGWNAFENCTGLKTVGLPSTLDSGFTGSAFTNCRAIEKMIVNCTAQFGQFMDYQDSLKTVEFGALATEVPAYAFKGCTKLTSVTLSNSITKIGKDAFSGCSALTSVTIPSSVTYIEGEAFSGSGLVEVTIPDSVTEMESLVFRQCANLKKVTLGKNITVINTGTFDGCASLVQINLDGVTEIGFEAFQGCSALTELNFGSLERVGYYAFKDCTGLKQVTMPKTLAELDHSVFWGCSGLESIRFAGNAPQIGGVCFKYVSCDAYYPLGNSTWTEEVRQNYGGQINWIGVEVLPEVNIQVARMILGNELAMQFAFPKENIAEGVEYVVSVTKTYADGREDKTILVPRSEWKTSGTYYYVSFNGIAAKEMGDEIRVQIQTADGMPVGEVYTDSIREYALRQLRKTNVAATRTLYVDMLNYGSAAQTYFKYDAANLSNGDLTETERGYATKSVNLENNLVKGEGYAASQLDLGSSILLRVKFNGIDDSMYAVVKFTNHNGREIEERVEGSEFLYSGTVVVIDQVVAADFDRDVTVKVYDAAGNEVANAVESVASYLARQLEKPNALAIYDAVAKYCASAYAYLHK